MSADRWSKCPKCLAAHETAVEKAVLKAKAKYGKVPVEDYQRGMEKAAALRSEPFVETLREDWQIGVDEHGLFVCSYSCHCSACHFNYEFKEAVTVDL